MSKTFDRQSPSDAPPRREPLPWEEPKPAEDDPQAPERVRELGWAATFLASPYARFVSGHTLVVDGANWQRRSLTNPPVVTVRDQMGKGPFAP